MVGDYNNILLLVVFSIIVSCQFQFQIDSLKIETQQSTRGTKWKPRMNESDRFLFVRVNEK